MNYYEANNSQKKKDIDDSPRAQVATSLLTYYIAGTFQYLIAWAKSKDAIDIVHKAQAGIDYNDITVLRDLWAFNDTKY